MNKKAQFLLLLCILTGVISIPQKSFAIDLKDILDHLLKRGTCAMLQVNIGDCAVEKLNPQTPIYPVSPNNSYPNYYPNYPQQNPTSYPQYPQYPYNQQLPFNNPYGNPQYPQNSPTPNEINQYPQSSQYPFKIP
jgi:hypothetical protein